MAMQRSALDQAEPNMSSIWRSSKGQDLMVRPPDESPAVMGEILWGNLADGSQGRDLHKGLEQHGSEGQE
jgi:hypothetical protein